MSLATLQPYWVAISAGLASAAPYAGAAAVVFAAVLLLFYMSLRRRLARLALGRNGSIEESVSILTRDLKELREFRVELEEYLKVAEQRMRGSVSGIGVVRFNPFGGEAVGGNQSFAVALLDEHGNGIVFSSLYARERSSVYAKPVERGNSMFELSEEEKEAIHKARERSMVH